jgi:soluble lytic murein transglycosylase-like protein
MRACVVVLAFTAFAQPALARDQSHQRSHQVTRHHHAAQHHVARRRHHVRMVRRRVEAPIESGYAMPRTFEEAEAMRPRQQRAWPHAPTDFTGFTPQAPVRTGRSAVPRDGALDAMIARHAAANGLPAELVHRVVIRESRYNPRARGAGGALGLMQIKHATARGVGYSGSAAGLLDPETNLTYAVRYLAGAYHAAGGNPRRAVAYYASGYHGRGMAARAAPTAWRSENVAMRRAHRTFHHARR